ncbi:MAG TPA: ABC transporter substrate-binding protein [Jatrophihabitantaceae bacterium]|jgi:osmoprotectant transport system substrate-binding protein
MKRTYLLAASLLASALALAACGSSGSSDKTSPPAGGNPSSGPATTSSGSSGPATYPAGPGSITVGSAGFTENILLADIYADAMSAKGVKVTKHTNIGERPIYMKALNDGSIDFIPEYSGSILSYLDSSATAKSPTDVDAALQQKLSDKLVALKYSPAQDSDTITVTQETATKYNLKSIADLAAVAGKLTLGAPAQFKTRADGVPALKSVYGVTFGRFTPLQAGGAITVTALKNGTVQAADIFSTDSSIAKNGFVSLEDPKNMFAAQNVVPILTKAKVTQPMVDACNAVSEKLDTKTLADLVAKAGTGDPDSVAKTWLASVGLG